MLLRVDTTSGLSIHEQLVGQVRAAIADGDLVAGQQLPPARQLAASLDVNVHTVLRAMQQLRDEGLVDIRRGRGTIVTGAAPRLAPLAEKVQQFVAEARQRGLTNTEIRSLLEGAL